MDAMDALRAILGAKRAPPEEPLSKPELRQLPGPGLKPKTLADVLKESAESTHAAPLVDLMTLLGERAANAPPPVQIMPADSPFAGLSRGPNLAAFSRISEVGKKKERKKPGWQEDEQKKEPVVKLSLLLLKEMGDDWQPHPSSSIEEARWRAGVQETFELKRILEIPRRPSDLTQYEDQTEIYKRPGGTMQLWPIQTAVLVEAERAGGLLGPIGVGHGKTLASLLVGVAMRATKIVLLVPPQLRTQLIEKDIPYLNEHWKLPLDRLRVVAYSELSHAKSAEILEHIKPDLIVGDEIHNLRHRSAARTKRFLRYMKEHPECRLVGLSGTITRRSLKDYQHLSELALKKHSPLPVNYRDLEDWAAALDVTKKDPMPPGALLQLCSQEELKQIAVTPMPHDAQVYVRQAYRRRMVETPGVVATEESALGTSLIIRGLRPLVPAEVQAALTNLRNTWEIDGEELMDAMSVARVARQLACGFFYRWVWPDGKKDYEWLEARKAWHKEVRDILKLSKRGLDSPLLVTKAVLRGELESGTWEAWAKVKDRFNPTPPTEAVWLTKFLVDEALRWAHETCHKTEPGIIWYEWDVVGREIAHKGGLPFFGPGMKAAEELTRVNAKQTPVIVCSRAAHGTGKNLQQFCRNLFTTPSPGGVDWEQTIARTHRPGQEADDVYVDVFLHTDEMQAAYFSAIRDALYIEQTQGQKQKLIYAKKVNCGP